MRDRMGNRLTWPQVVSKGSDRILAILLDFQLYLVMLAGLVPFHFFRRLAYSLCGLRQGRGGAIHMWARFNDLANIVIGQDTIIGDHAFLDGRAPLRIGNHVDIASEVMIYNSEHAINAEDFGATLAPVEIGDYVFIGPRVIIMPGVTIGTGAVVAGGAVVTHNVPDFAIVGGVPAKVIGQRLNTSPHYRLGRARLFQ